MSDDSNFGFARLVPGFDFLQNLAKGASQAMPQMPNLSNWVAPTLNVEELDKRISELRAVHFWLDQNSKALGATIQALEVQKMTLATLHGMNVSMGEVANALKLKTADAMADGMQKMTEAAGAMTGANRRKAKEAPADKAEAAAPKDEAAPAKPAAKPVDPMQWWGALTQQFQEIAANAMKDVAQNAAAAPARNMAAATAKEPARQAATQTPKDSGKPAKKAPARKAAPRKRSAAKSS